jgi:hypothetical protein
LQNQDVRWINPYINPPHHCNQTIRYEIKCFEILFSLLFFYPYLFYPIIPKISKISQIYPDCPQISTNCMVLELGSWLVVSEPPTCAPLVSFTCVLYSWSEPIGPNKKFDLSQISSCRKQFNHIDHFQLATNPVQGASRCLRYTSTQRLISLQHCAFTSRITAAHRRSGSDFLPRRQILVLKRWELTRIHCWLKSRARRRKRRERPEVDWRKTKFATELAPNTLYTPLIKSSEARSEIKMQPINEKIDPKRKPELKNRAFNTLILLKLKTNTRTR